MISKAGLPTCDRAIRLGLGKAILQAWRKSRVSSRTCPGLVQDLSRTCSRTCCPFCWKNKGKQSETRRGSLEGLKESESFLCALERVVLQIAIKRRTSPGTSPGQVLDKSWTSPGRNPRLTPSLAYGLSKPKTDGAVTCGQPSF